MIGKTLSELRYELDNRPEWLSIPLCGLLRLNYPPDTYVPI